MLRTILAAALILVLSGCSDKLSLEALSGTYTGKFHYITPELSEKVTADAKVIFTERSYSSQGNTNKIPAGGSGDFELQEGKILDFKDENIWTANFDWGLILNGRYNYDIKGDSLILTRHIEPCPNCSMQAGSYQYRLKRTN